MTDIRNIESSLLACPVCQCDLSHAISRYVCEQGHSFDIAKQGYVNLLVGKKKYGDDTMMVEARRDFLSTRAYMSLIEKIHALIGAQYGDGDLSFADIGCGEGRYMRMLQQLRNNPGDRLFGLDISKDAVKYACKQMDGLFVVANSHQLPVQDHSFDVMISIFSPYDEEEIARCLKPDGVAIIVSPGKEHLYQFIEMIWDDPHRHIITPSEEKYTLLSLQRSYELDIALDLVSSPDISNLFKMTPYYWKAPKDKQAKILGLEELHTQASFVIDVVQI